MAAGKKAPGSATPAAGSGDGESASGSAPDPPEDLRSWASFCHFSALFGLLLWVPSQDYWVPVGHLLGPVLVWLSKKNGATLIDLAGREAINFQLTMSAYGAALVLVFSQVFLLSYLVLALVLADLVLTIKAGVVTSRGEPFRYPLVFYRVLR